MMIGMDVMKLSRSQDGESWRDIGGASGRVGRGGISAVFLHFSFSLSLFHFGQPWMPSCRVLWLPNKPADPIDLFLKQLSAKSHGTEVMECPIREDWQ